MNVIIKISCEGKFITEINQKGEIFFEDGTKLIRKNFKELEFICDNCDSKSKWTSVPSKSFLLKNF